ncbi:MAG: MFS transporter [Acidobacteriaceae bacterium]|nr:MFS transporter [Acidobacteriaceae bacterium]
MELTQTTLPSGLSREKHLRWFFIAWLTVATILNYLDRQTLSILAPVLRDEFHLSNQAYSRIVSSFLISYTVMYTAGGRFVDWVGERVGMAISIAWWSVATMLHSLAAGAVSFGVFRFLLGIGEPANYPAALKAAIAWFSEDERGLPVAIYTSGSAVGAVFAPPLITWIALRYGWRYAFVLPGSMGLLWVIVWLRTYRRPARGTAEIATEEAGATVRPRWATLLRDRNVIALVAARFLADPVWYFYLFWIPEYLKRSRGFTLGDIGLYGWIPFLAADIGGVFGGFASDRLIKAGMPAATARRLVLYCFSAVAPVGVFTGFAKSPATAVALMAIGGFVCFVWFVNTAALVSDVFAAPVVGSVLGILGTAGSGAGALFTLLVGFLADRGSYVSVFVIAGSMHLLASVVLFLCMKPARHCASTSEVAQPQIGRS